jgi:hypothetical protein
MAAFGESDHYGYEQLFALRRSIDALSGLIESIGNERLSTWRSWSLE